MSHTYIHARHERSCRACACMHRRRAVSPAYRSSGLRRSRAQRDDAIFLFSHISEKEKQTLLLLSLLEHERPRVHTIMHVEWWSGGVGGGGGRNYIGNGGRVRASMLR